MKNRNSGFTLVELIVVVLVVGLLVLVTTQIPLFGLSSWRKGSERLKLQRDAHYAMIYIQRKLRPASITMDPTVFVTDLGFPTVFVTDDGTFLDVGDVRLSVDSNHDLVQSKLASDRKPIQNKDIIVIRGEEGTKFMVEEPNGKTINMELTLVRGNVDIILTTAVKPRN